MNASAVANGCEIGGMEREYMRRHHRHEVAENQCSSALVKHIRAPVPLVIPSSRRARCGTPVFRGSVDVGWGVKSVRARVSMQMFASVWSLVRRFDQPQKYKPFVSRCVVRGNLEIGSLREVDVKSGLPATTSTERLELLDDDEHILSIRIVGGDHRLRNYSSIISLHPEIIEGRPGTLVIESYVVDVPEGNTKDETCYFVEALIKCNLKSLADVSERLAVQDRTEPIDMM
ncbi:abscisic acid receptor PYL8 isoform X1 [Syzygium oleosum]|uniref:abscisic acid receptor PYL8 isoform X1 n=1 Tax=Syzygium oleosum TaxID=219896 RepID=UPI0024B8F6A9|nr:abscisic acid receptor PYL8 isoform X1 [Syzygium oleosum]